MVNIKFIKFISTQPRVTHVLYTYFFHPFVLTTTRRSAQTDATRLPQRYASTHTLFFLSTTLTTLHFHGIHCIVHMSNNCSKRMLHIARILGTCFHIMNAVSFGKTTCFFHAHRSFMFQIQFATYQHFLEGKLHGGMASTLVDATVPIYFAQPLLCILKRFVVGDVEQDQHTLGAAVVTACDGTKTILTCCIPNL